MAHEHEHSHDHDAVAQMLSAAHWDERYAAGAVWSGRPNDTLVAEATDLTPGVALDVGCGEGADAIWLAARGWQVTGIDISAVGLRRAAEHAQEAGVAERATWTVADLRDWTPEPAYDLVAAHFLQLPSDLRGDLQRRLAGGVRPGGTLLVVGHDFSDVHAGVGRPSAHDLFFTAADVAGVLDPEAWEVVVAESRPRPTTGLDGEPTTIHDAVLRARRR